jgi:glycosyltransferase 2 family protein
VALLAVCVLAVFLVCLWSQSIINLLPWKVFGFPKWGSLAVRAVDTIKIYRRSPGTLVAALGASMLANLTLIVVTALGMLVVNPSGLAMKMCLVVPIGFIANSLPLTPGGLGVGETAFNALFDITGLHDGADVLMCWRIWSAFVGLLGLIFYLRGLRRSVVNPVEVQ